MNIIWRAPSEAKTFKLKYSLDDGLTWNLIADGISAPSLTWTEVPLPIRNKNASRIKVISYDGSGAIVGVAISPPFTIEGGVKITSPNGGERLSPGSQHDITWQTRGSKASVERAEIWYTTNGGVTWNLIKKMKGNPGSYFWTVPPVKKTRDRCLIKIVLRAATGEAVGIDQTDSFLTIAGP
jgi:hypothetical protein